MVEANADTLVSLLTIVALLASLSSAIDIDQFLLKIKKPKGILIGLVCQYGILPVTAFVMSYIFSLPPAIAVALVIIGTCPGGAMSNFWCFAFSADLPLSIAMTTCSSLLSFAFIAMNGAIYIPILSKGSTLNIDWLALGLSVAAVLVGILIGVIIAKYHNMKLIKFMGFLGTATMITILIWALVNVSNSNAPLKDSPPLVFAAIVCMNIVALALSFGISLCLKMKRNSAVSVAIEASNQNAALAIAILLLSVDSGYDRDLALNVPVIYMLTNILFVLCFGLILRRSGWLPIDWEDKTITLGKIIQQWREKRKQGDSNEEIDNASLEEEEQQKENEKINKSVIELEDEAENNNVEKKQQQNDNELQTTEAVQI